MTGLAEQELNQSTTRVWLGRVALFGGIAVALILIGWLISGISVKTGGGAKKQTVAIKVLPDTPPPPPPPPKPEDKPPPPQEVKQTMQMEAPKVQAPQEAPAALKMEGAAGDGPSAFAAGSVSKDYVGGPVGNGNGGTGTQSNRAQFQFFFNTAKQQLKDEIERHLKTDSPELTAVFSIWLDNNGSIKRFVVAPSGDAETDAQVKAALDETSRALRLQPPPDLPQPMKFRLSLRPQG